jgi:hypothetical protein
MNKEAFKEELMIRRRQQYLSSLTTLGRSVLKAKLMLWYMIEEERRCGELQNAK